MYRIILFLLGVFWPGGLLWAQSADPNAPTPLSSNLLHGVIQEKDATNYYYAVLAGPGAVTFTLRVSSRKLPNYLEVEVRTPQQSVLKFDATSDAADGRSETLQLQKQSPLLIRIRGVKFNSSGSYTLSLKGPLQFSSPMNSAPVIPPPSPMPDKTAPRITITSPSLVRGQGIAIQNYLTVSGYVTDESGLRDVTVQNRAVTVSAAGQFITTIPLVVGEQQILVTATDVHGNQAQERFTVRRESPTPSPSPAPDTTRYFALVIGNNAYRFLRPLQTAVNDAQEVARMLATHYGFQTKLLLNAGREDTLREINALRRVLTADQQLLIYYAGHGYFDREVSKAYWLPVDARETDNVNWISADDVTTNMRGIPARHILIVSDSCYSGTLARDAVRRPTIPAEREQYLAKMLQGTSRTLMASGGNEPVADDGGGGKHSVFAAALLRGLQQMAPERFTAEELFFGFVKEAVAGRADQTPEYSVLRSSGHEAGDFVFVRVKP